MPTGYTCVITEKPDLTFREFAMRCARAFGACILQRDDDVNAPLVTKVEPLAHYREWLEKAEAKARELETMTPAEATAKAKAEHRERVKSNREYAASYHRENKLYAAMLAKVEAWEPPTSDHVGMKDFMRQQIEASRNNGGPYQCDETLRSGKEWLARARLDARENLDRCRKDWNEEVKRAAERTKWIEALVASLSKGNAGGSK